MHIVFQGHKGLLHIFAGQQPEGTGFKLARQLATRASSSSDGCLSRKCVFFPNVTGRNQTHLSDHFFDNVQNKLRGFFFEQADAPFHS